MGLFDSIKGMFGRGSAEAAKQPNAEQRFNELKQKYQSALSTADQQHIQFQNLHMQDSKLYIRAVAPSEAARDQFWQQIRLINPAEDDITTDVTVDESRAQGAATGGGQAAGQTYTVKSGDTLSKISRQFYGDADEYMRIFYANRDKPKDPDKIQVGQEFVIPPDDNA
ncbi:MAG: LysM peptidoglycan-binding domain-containing protein [Acidobacteriota bacterium]|nr:LysM peptidoglycan-binding domain-containing protein [Acidobacteriota bacterium]